MSEVRIYRPPFRVLFDMLIMGNALLFMNFLFDIVEVSSLETPLVVYNVFACLFWGLSRFLLKVKIEESKITGPSIFLYPTSILLRKVDLHRSCKKTAPGKIFGYQDIWSIDGNRVRVCRRFFERKQFHSIIKEIEKHPFREGSSS